MEEEREAARRTSASWRRRPPQPRCFKLAPLRFQSPRGDARRRLSLLVVVCDVQQLPIEEKALKRSGER